MEGHAVRGWVPYQCRRPHWSRIHTLLPLTSERSHAQVNESIIRPAARTRSPAAAEAVDDSRLHQEGRWIRLRRASDRLDRSGQSTDSGSAMSFAWFAQCLVPPTELGSKPTRSL